MQKKLQIFISSTYTDLLVERQSAVEAILRSGNIPAGMELFSSGNKSQWDTIKKWIDESDIFILILGGRYGSLDPETKISYIELEYKYAVECGKPFFALVLNDEMLDNKNRIEGKNVFEFENQVKYKEFKELVLSKVCRLCKDISEIKLSILESVIDIGNHYSLTGWVKGNEIPDYTILINELEKVREEKEQFKLELSKVKQVKQDVVRTNMIGEYTYKEILQVLTNKSITIPANMNSDKLDKSITLLEAFIRFKGFFIPGIVASSTRDWDPFFIHAIVPTLLSFNLMERVKYKGVNSGSDYDKIIISVLGNKFLSIYDLEINNGK